MNNQDWNEVVFMKSKKIDMTQLHRDGKIESVSRNIKNSSIKNDVVSNKILEDETSKLPRVSKQTGNLISQYRLKLNLTRKQLAQAINQPESVISNYENGTAILNRQTLNNIYKKLNIKNE